MYTVKSKWKTEYQLTSIKYQGTALSTSTVVSSLEWKRFHRLIGISHDPCIHVTILRIIAQNGVAVGLFMYRIRS